MYKLNTRDIMKSALLVLGLLLFGLSGSLANPGVSFDVFYSSLSPHGEWIAVDGGAYAWRPVGVEVGWRPYGDGRWCWTDDGWYWASSEPWSWATYHYGRWYNDDSYGWVWVPGYDWAPSWVEWRYGGDYVGWAPLSPYAVFSVGFGIHYRSYWITPHAWWSFVDCRYIADPYVHRYVYRPENNTRYIGRTRSAGSVRYTGGRVITRGPDREYVERRGNIRLERAEIRDVADRSVDRVVRDGGRERVEVYRPKIEDRAGTDRTRPDRVREADHGIALDMKGMDVNSRNVDREAGRDTRRAEDLRKRVSPRSEGPHDLDRDRQRDDGQQPGVGRSRERDGQRRSESGIDNSRGRSDEQREVRKDREVERRPERERSAAPEVKTRRSESSSVGRTAAPRSEGTRGADSGSRGGGRKR